MAAALVNTGKTKTSLILSMFNANKKFFGLIATRQFSDEKIPTAARTENRGDDGKIKKTVFISQSYDIFTNLALEDWIYSNFNLKNHHILMLWANNPTVVIGRHQNPYTEANVKALQQNDIEFARRNSGGGTVYHDRGNLNCSFLTPRDRYNRKYNLNLITRALYREWGIKADISDRDDIILNGKKVRFVVFLLKKQLFLKHITHYKYLRDFAILDFVNLIFFLLDVDLNFESRLSNLKQTIFIFCLLFK